MLTDEQVQKTLRTTMLWRASGNVFSAKVRLAALRSRLKGARRDDLDRKLAREKFLRAVLDADHPSGRTGFGEMPKRRRDR